ncbi:MAG: PrsW family glutamic-type intramembrane protease, partial [Patescibacteria group bacterium]
MLPSTSLFLSFLGGILPAIIWLLFWLREDRREPEPRHLIVATFLAGVAATIPVIFIETAIGSFIPGKGLGVLVLWATVEEIAKFSAAFLVALRRRENDQPIDNMIYLMTAAIGFAAFENFFYLVDPLQQADLARGAVMGSLRFLGSTILHTVASGAIGIALAYAFCAP